MGSYAQTIMKDQRLILEEAQVVAAPESTIKFQQTYPGSVAVGQSASVGDIVFEEYTPLVAETVGKLIESVNLVQTKTIPTLFESFNLSQSGLVTTFGKAVSETAAQSMKVTEVLGEKLTQTQQGVSSILPGMVGYLVVAAVVIIIVGKVWK